jgi:hypothetical protein
MNNDYDFDSIKDGTFTSGRYHSKSRNTSHSGSLSVEGIEISLIVFYVFWKGVDIVLYSFLYNQKANLLV